MHQKAANLSPRIVDQGLGACKTVRKRSHCTKGEQPSFLTSAVGRYSAFIRHRAILIVGMRWSTVTVTATGRRHSLDLPADSTYDAAHLYFCRAKESMGEEFPNLTAATIFAVVNGGRVYQFEGRALQRWIVKRRSEWNGPRGFLFSKRPGLE
jgi:hypothetical protein